MSKKLVVRLVVDFDIRTDTEVIDIPDLVETMEKHLEAWNPSDLCPSAIGGWEGNFRLRLVEKE